MEITAALAVVGSMLYFLNKKEDETPSSYIEKTPQDQIINTKEYALPSDISQFRDNAFIIPPKYTGLKTDLIVGPLVRLDNDVPSKIYEEYANRNLVRKHGNMLFFSEQKAAISFAKRLGYQTITPVQLFAAYACARAERNK
mgnify:FL=1